MSLPTFVPWVRSWLRVSRSVSSHRFALRAGGGGEPGGPLFRMPCGSASFSGACSVVCPTAHAPAVDAMTFLVQGVLVFFYYVLSYIFVLYCVFSSSSYCGFCRVPVFMGPSDMTRDVGS